MAFKPRFNKLGLRRPVQVAFMGIDGSGKSSLEQRLRNSIGKQGYSVKTVTLPSYKTSGKSTRFITEIATRVEKMGEESKKKKIAVAGTLASIFLWNFLRFPYQKQKPLTPWAKPRDFLFIDRHPVIEAEALGKVYKFPKAVQIAKILASASLPDVVVLVNCSPSTAFKRIQQRKDQTLFNPVYNGMGIHERPEYLRSLARDYAQIARRLKKKGVFVIEINGNQPPGLVQKEAALKLEQALKRVKKTGHAQVFA